LLFYWLATMKRMLIFFSLLIFTGILASCSLKPAYLSPEGTWSYPGGDAKPMSIVFNPNGTLTFVGGFKNFNPATWQYDKQTQKLRIQISNYDKAVAQCDFYYSEEYTCLSYIVEKNIFEGKFTDKTRYISFLGWNFFLK
jgi:hypothetical protein